MPVPHRRSLTLRLFLALVAVAITGVAAATPAHAARSMSIGIADDRVLLQGTDAEVAAATADWAKLGVDVVRIHAVWGAMAPATRSKTMPRGLPAGATRIAAAAVSSSIAMT